MSSAGRRTDSRASPEGKSRKPVPRHALASRVHPPGGVSDATGRCIPAPTIPVPPANHCSTTAHMTRSRWGIRPSRRIIAHEVFASRLSPRTSGDRCLDRRGCLPASLGLSGGFWVSGGFPGSSGGVPGFPGEVRGRSRHRFPRHGSRGSRPPQGVPGDLRRAARGRLRRSDQLLATGRGSTGRSSTTGPVESRESTPPSFNARR